MRFEGQPPPKLCTARRVCALGGLLCTSCLVLSSTQVAASLLQKDALEGMAGALPGASHQPFLSGLSRIQSVDVRSESTQQGPSLEETQRLSSLRVMDWIHRDTAATAVAPAADAPEHPLAALALDQPLAAVADPQLPPIEDPPVAPDSNRQGHPPEWLSSHPLAQVTDCREHRTRSTLGTHRDAPSPGDGYCMVLLCHHGAVRVVTAGRRRQAAGQAMVQAFAGGTSAAARPAPACWLRCRLTQSSG